MCVIPRKAAVPPTSTRPPTARGRGRVSAGSDFSGSEGQNRRYRSHRSCFAASSPTMLIRPLRPVRSPDQDLDGFVDRHAWGATRVCMTKGVIMHKTRGPHQVHAWKKTLSCRLKALLGLPVVGGQKTTLRAVRPESRRLASTDGTFSGGNPMPDEEELSASFATDIGVNATVEPTYPVRRSRYPASRAVPC
jgi:hypothetical protein